MNLPSSDETAGGIKVDAVDVCIVCHAFSIKCVLEVLKSQDALFTPYI